MFKTFSAPHKISKTHLLRTTFVTLLRYRILLQDSMNSEEAARTALLNSMPSQCRHGERYLLMFSEYHFYYPTLGTIGIVQVTHGLYTVRFTSFSSRLILLLINYHHAWSISGLPPSICTKRGKGEFVSFIVELT